MTGREDVPGWKREDRGGSQVGLWHAVTALDGRTFAAACGDEIPVDEVSSWSDSEPFNVQVCGDCLAARREGSA